MYTPWGESDNVTKLAEGIYDVSTPSHGGIKLSPERANQIPANATNFLNQSRNGYSSNLWWEEDCDWAVPYVIFKDDIVKSNPYRFKENLESAYLTIKRYHPELSHLMPTTIQ